MAGNAPEIKVGPPYEIEISQQLSGRYGYKDARVEVMIKVPAPFSVVKKELTLQVAPEDVDKLYEALKKAKMWAELPDFQRERDGV